MLPLTVQFLVAMLAYGLNERMARKADYLREENRVLKEALQAATGRRASSAKTRSSEDCSLLVVAREPSGGSPRLCLRRDDGRNGVPAGTDWVKADSTRAFAPASWLRFAMIQSDE